MTYAGESASVEVDHGDVRMYFRGCRCEPCLESNRVYGRRVTRQKAYGTWEPRIDAGPVREHVRRQMDAFGCGCTLVSRMTGVSVPAIQRILGVGRTTRTVTPRTADRLLSLRITLDSVPPAQMVPSIGTRRRVQALSAVGWSRNQVAALYGIDRVHMDRISRQERISAEFARLMRRAYADLRDRDPLAAGMRPNAVTLARNLAARRSWAPPHCWDDDTIDYPDAIPEWTGMCGTWQGAHIHYKQKILPCCGPCRTADRAHRAEMRQAALASESNSVVDSVPQ